MTIKKLIVAAALAAPSALAIAAPAQAQVAGIATASPTVAIGNSKALASANQLIDSTYKSAFDQVEARQNAMRAEVQPLLAQIDTNKDKKVDDAELEAAQKANNPVLQRINTAQTNAQNDIARLSAPALRAQAFAIESILRKYNDAQMAVVNARKISVILSPDAFLYAPQGADVTAAITQELDRQLPTVQVTPPDNWQPSRQTIELQQQLAQLAQVQQYRAAQAAAAAQQQPATGARPATTAPAPAPAKKPQPQGR